MSKKTTTAPKPPRFKKTKRATLIAGGLLLAGGLSFPIWSVWLAKPIAAMAGVDITSVDSLSWDRWHIKGLSLEKKGLSLKAKTIELPSPSAIVLQYLSPSPAEQSLVVKKWALATDSSAAPQEESGPTPTLDSLLALVDDGLTQLGGFLKEVQLTDGEITLDGTKTLGISSLVLTPESLQAEANYLPEDIDASLAVAFAETWTLSSRIPKLKLATDLTLLPTPGNLTLDGNITTAGNPIAIHSRWASDEADFLPHSATLSTQGFVLDSRYAPWEDVPPLYLDSDVEWADKNISYRILGSDTAGPITKPQIEISGNGSLEKIIVETARVDLPWLELRNDKAIQIDPSLENPLTDAQLTAKLKLDEFPFANAKGDVVAHLRTKSSQDKLPIIAATLQGSAISFFDTTIDKLNGEMELHGKTLSLHSFDLETSNGSTLSGQGGYDIATQQIPASQLAIALKNESEILRNLLPTVEWETLNANVEIQGPLDQLAFQATLDSQDLLLPGTQTFSFEADARGQLSQMQAKLKANNGSETFLLELETATEASDTLITLSKLELQTEDKTSLLSLDSPRTVRIQNSDSSISLPELTLSGADGLAIALNNILVSPEKLSLQSEIQNFAPSIFENWLAEPLPPIALQSLSANLLLDPAGSETSISGHATYSLNETSSVDLSWLANTNHDHPDDLTIEQLLVSSSEKHIFAANGTFPVSLAWVQSSLKAEPHLDEPFTFNLNSSPHPDFWRALEEIVPVSITRPQLDAALTGTINHPKGHFNLKLDSLQWSDPQDASKSLNVEQLQASLLADSSSISIETLDGRVGQNHIKANATLPLKGRSLVALLKSPDSLDTSDLTAQAEIEVTELAALKDWLPPMLRHRGQANIKLLVDSGKLTASGRLEDLATRPMPPLGALSGISGSFLFEDGIWKTDGITGTADKSPFTLVGQADLNSLEKPLFDLNFSSKEFPLIRDDGLILSGDIDMNLVSTDKGQPQIQGELILKKGLALVEPDLLASSTKTVSTRPPYFAVEQEPFNDWGLDIDIHGEQFLRVSNSFFQGTLSAEFVLEGNLGAPILIGKAETYGGQVFFPASSLKLKAGRGFITRDRPSDLQIEAVAEGRLFGYDINLDVRGTADNPELVITSNPALTQVQALLLLTTGATPDGGGSLAQQSATSLGVFIGKGLFKKLTGGNSDSASKLNLEIGQEISLQGKKTIDASYQLSEDLQIEGEYDKRDEFNANLKWTIFKR